MAALHREMATELLLAAGKDGLTHHELRDRLNDTKRVALELHTVCWIIGDLKKKRQVAFYPVVGWNAERTKSQLLLRRGRQVLVHEHYRGEYPHTPPRSTSP